MQIKRSNQAPLLPVLHTEKSPGVGIGNRRAWVISPTVRQCARAAGNVYTVVLSERVPESDRVVSDVAGRCRPLGSELSLHTDVPGMHERIVQVWLWGEVLSR